MNPRERESGISEFIQNRVSTKVSTEKEDLHEMAGGARKGWLWRIQGGIEKQIFKIWVVFLDILFEVFLTKSYEKKPHSCLTWADFEKWIEIVNIYQFYPNLENSWSSNLLNEHIMAFMKLASIPRRLQKEGCVQKIPDELQLNNLHHLW